MGFVIPSNSNASQPDFYITGVAIDVNMTPLRNTYIVCEKINTTDYMTGTTNSDGFYTFNLAGMPNGYSDQDVYYLHAETTSQQFGQLLGPGLHDVFGPIGFGYDGMPWFSGGLKVWDYSASYKQFAGQNSVIATVYDVPSSPWTFYAHWGYTDIGRDDYQYNLALHMKFVAAHNESIYIYWNNDTSICIPPNLNPQTKSVFGGLYAILGNNYDGGLTQFSVVWYGYWTATDINNVTRDEGDFTLSQTIFWPLNY